MAVATSGGRDVAILPFQGSSQSVWLESHLPKTGRQRQGHMHRHEKRHPGSSGDVPSRSLMIAQARAGATEPRPIAVAPCQPRGNVP